MQIFVKTLTSRTMVLDVDPSWNVSQVKEAIYNNEGIDASMQKLHHSGSMLEDSETLAGLDIQPESTFYLTLALAGGKKKKKAYTTKKKNKHKHKSTKLATLTLYSVDGNGKIVRNRKQCNQPTCGPGVFMARHFDRHYCGRCADMIKVEKHEILKVEKKVKKEDAPKEDAKGGKKDGKKKK